MVYHYQKITSQELTVVEILKFSNFWRMILEQEWKSIHLAKH